MFVGESGVERIVQRTAELMKQDPERRRARSQGGIPLDMIQRHLNFWYALSLDLFGGEISSNAAAYFASGLKGRANEEKYAEHTALHEIYRMNVVRDGKASVEDVPMRNAMNEVLRDAYIGRLPARRGPLEQETRRRRPQRAPGAGRQALLPPHRHVRRHAVRPDRAAC